MAPTTRTIEFTPEDADGDRITPEWIAGMAEGLEEEELGDRGRIVRVELTVETPE